MELIKNDTLDSLLELLDLPQENLQSGLKSIATADGRYLRDLRINFSNSINSETFSAKEIALLGLSVASLDKNVILINFFEKKARAASISEEEIAEAYSCASIMTLNNIFYRFKHYVPKDYYSQTPAGIKMSILGNPKMGKELFELISLCISAVNGCEACVKSHENSVLAHGASEAKVYEAIRFAGVVKSMSVLVF